VSVTVLVMVLADDVLDVLVVLLVVEDDGRAVVLLVDEVGRAGRLLVRTVVLAVVTRVVAAVVRVSALAVVVVGTGAGIGARPGRSSAGRARVGVWNGAGRAACRFHHNGLLFSVSS
jgi:hypothetical protein